MADDYSPKTWADGIGGGTPIDAASLNHVEAGLADVTGRVKAVEATVGQAAPATAPASQQVDVGRVALRDLGDVAGPVVLDLTVASSFKMRLTGAASINVIGWSPLQAIQTVQIHVQQDYIGSRDLAWPSSFAADGSLPTTAPLADVRSIYQLITADQGANVMLRHVGSFAAKDRYDLAVGDLFGLGYYLPLAEASGTTAADLSGQNRSGTYSSSGLTLANTATVPSSQRKAPLFQGTGYVATDALQVGSNPATPFSIGFTVMSADVGTSRVELYAETLSTNATTGVLIGSSGTLLANGRAQARFEVTDAAGNQQVYRALSASIFDANPHLVIVTGDGSGGYAIYVDGALDQSWAPSSPAPVTVDRATWGARRSSTTTRYLPNGALGRVFARTAVTTLTEAQGLWAAFQSGTSTGGGSQSGGGTADGYDANGVKMGTPTATINGQTVTFAVQVQTNKPVTFAYLQMAIRGPGTVNASTATSPGLTVNGTATLTGTVTFTQYGAGQVWGTYSLVPNPAQSDWRDGVATSFTVAAPAPTGGGTTGGGTTGGGTTGGGTTGGGTTGGGTTGGGTTGGGTTGGGTTTGGVSYLDGVAGTTVDSGYASWLGHTPSMGGTWCDSADAQVNLWTVRPGAEFGSWAKPLDIAVGAIYKGSGETWAAAAAGSYNTRWTQCLTNLATYWGNRDTSLLYIRFAHEFNLSSSDWAVSGSDATNFKSAWRRFRALQKQILPTVKLVWCPNDGTSGSLSLDVRNAFPGADQCDVVGIDCYNMWPWINTVTDFTNKLSQVDGYGAPVGPEKWRLQAASWGLPLAFGEWGSSAVDGGGSGGGDSPTYIEQFATWMKTNMGSGAGQVLYAVYFNISNQFQIYPVAAQPNASAKYKAVFGAMGPNTGSGGTTTTTGGGTTTGGTTGGGTGGGTTSGGGFPAKAVAVYKMMWSSNGPALSSINTKFNVVNLAFAQGSPPSLVGWGTDGQSAFISAANAMKARGVKFILSVGGGGGSYDTSNRSGFLQGVASIYSQFALDGLDWDLEGSTINQSDIVYISTKLKQTYGANFAITFAPNGGNVGSYLPIAVACQQAGALDSYGQQFYDATVSLSAAEGRIQEALNAGITQAHMSVGMMIASDSNHWTNQQCHDNMAAIRAKWPGITKAFLWEASRSGTSQWADDMYAIVNS